MKKIASLFLFCAMFLSCTQSSKKQEPDIVIPEKTEVVTKITLYSHYQKLNIDSSLVLSYRITPTSLQNKTSIIWSSSNTNVAVVNNGEVTAQNSGEAYIIAQVLGTSIQDSCKIYVPEIIFPPAIEFSKLQCDGLDLNLEPISDNKYSVSGVYAQKRVTGQVEFIATSKLNSIGITYNAYQISNWGIGLLDYSRDWITSAMEKPQNGTYYYTYSGGVFSKFAFAFTPTGYDPVSVPIKFSVTDKKGKSTSIEVIFNN